MIYHILQGNILHLTPGILKSTCQNASRISEKTADKHFFCINMFCDRMLYKNVDVNPYDNLFREIGFNQYRLIDSNYSLFKIFLHLQKNDSVIFHSNPPAVIFFVINLFLLLFRRDMLKRITYVCWGNDFDFRGDHLKNKIYNLLVRYAFNAYNSIVTICPQDKEKVKTLYSKANVYYAEYVSSEKRTLLSKIKTDESKPIVVVSHSGWQHNRHINSFEILQKFTGRIRVVCPLCYGNKEYIAQVIEHGHKIFGADFSYFTELKEKTEYRDWLRTTDIYISSAESQTGLGAINFSMWSGSKIFLTGDLLKYYRESGYVVSDVNSISSMSFDNFSSKMETSEAQQNIDMFNNKMYYAPEPLKVWKAIYEL